MKTKKALIEKRNDLKVQAEKLASVAKKRALTVDEAQEVKNIKSEAEEVRSALKQYESGIEDSIKRGNGQMDEKEKIVIEQRAVADMLRGHYNTENIKQARDFDITSDTSDKAGNGGVNIPTDVESQVIKYMVESSPAFALAQRIPSNGQNIRVPRETDLEEAGFVGETANANSLPTTFSYATLSQKRIGAKIQISNSILNSSAVKLVPYATDRLGRAAGLALDRTILTGKGDVEFTGVIGNNASDQQLTLAAQDAPTVKELLDIKNTLNPSYLDGAVWIVSRTVFNNIAKLQDGDGRYLIFQNNVASVPGQSLLGAPIHVSRALEGSDTGIIFGNFNRGYAIAIADGVSIKSVNNDSAMIDADATFVALVAHMDGTVVDPYAFVTAGVAGGATTTTTSK